MGWHHRESIVDSHVHAGLRKYEPLEAVLDQMFRHGVSQAVLIQHLGEFDAGYLSECCQRFPGRFAAAVVVDTTRADAPSTLEKWAARPGIRGVRLHPDDPLSLWDAADRLGLAVSLYGSVSELARPETRRRLQTHPSANCCIEHMGMPEPTEGEPYSTYRSILALCSLPNLYMKISGYYGFTKEGYPYVSVVPFAQMALQAFGARRLMWGSDFPPVSSREGYGNALAFGEVLFPDLSAEDRSWLMGKTAQQVWRLREQIV